MKNLMISALVLGLLVFAGGCYESDDGSFTGDGDAEQENGDLDADADADAEPEAADADMSEQMRDGDSGGCMGDIDYTPDGDIYPPDGDHDADSAEKTEESDTAADGDSADGDCAELDGSEEDAQPDGDTAESDGDTEADDTPEACPSDMVRINDYCIDRYEASRPDAGAASPGVDESQAVSRAGVIPWFVNPMNSAHLAEFQAACTAAGKHLCSAGEWFEACNGPDNHTYVWGDSFDPEICNCVDTYCDDYCADNGITSENCNTAANCGYACGATSRVSCFHVNATGNFADCTNEYGAYDVNGNVWEIVPVSTEIDSRGYMVRGGAFNCAAASDRLKCDYNATWDSLYAGFRCCKYVDGN